MAQFKIQLSAILRILCFSYVICRASTVYLHIKPTIISEPQCPEDHKSCLTLQQFSKNTSQHYNSSASLILEFLPGNHSLQLQSVISIYNVPYLKLFSWAKNSSSIFTNNVTFKLINISVVEISYLTFHGFDFPVQIRYQPRPVLSITFSNLYLNECKFYDTKGTIISAKGCNIEIYKSKFINCSQIIVAGNCNISDTGSYYFGNVAEILLPSLAFPL